MVVAILKESDMVLSDEFLEAIIDKVGVCKSLLQSLQFISLLRIMIVGF